MTARRIVVGYDGSEASQVALTWAMREAELRGLTVLIVSVEYEPSEVGFALGGLVDVPRDEVLADRRRLLLAAEHTSRLEVPGVEVESRAMEGSPVRVLLDLAEGAEMCVVGGRGAGGFSELLIGSTSLQLAAHATCPVVVVRSVDYVEPGPEAGRVVVGVDGSGPSAAALAFAFEEASLRGCGLTALHGWEWTYFELPTKTQAELVHDYRAIETSGQRILAEVLAGWTEKYPDVDVRRHAVHGDPERALIEASAGAALLVVGSRGRGGFQSLLLGSVSHTVLHHAKSAVAVVRATSTG
jgi:nucleotide-binding universal stress UspA family protein